MSNSTFIKSALRAIAVILLMVGNIIAGTFLFTLMGAASTLSNISGLVGIIVVLVVNYFVIKGLFQKKTHTNTT